MKMTEMKQTKYDLEKRTLQFAKDVRNFVKVLPRTISKKDFLLRVKISRKEAKESRFWLELIDVGDNNEIGKRRTRLIQEATELTNIFGSIIRKCE